MVAYLNGSLHYHDCGYLGKVRTNNECEYIGLIAGLDYALAYPEIDDVAICSDSLLAIKQVQGQYRVKSKTLKPLVELARLKVDELRKTRKRFQLLKVKGHSGIEGNEEADKLAKHAAKNRWLWAPIIYLSCFSSVD